MSNSLLGIKKPSLACLSYTKKKHKNIQPSHDVGTTLYERWINVKTLNRRRSNVFVTSCDGWVTSIEKEFQNSAFLFTVMFSYQTQPSKALKGKPGGVNFCWIGTQNAMLYAQKYTPSHFFFSEILQLWIELKVSPTHKAILEEDTCCSILATLCDTSYIMCISKSSGVVLKTFANACNKNNGDDGDTYWRRVRKDIYIVNQLIYWPKCKQKIK